MKNELTANRLNEALQNVGITAQELSKKSGVSKASISQYRNGVHAPNNISAGKMAKILNVNPLWLMGFDVDKNEIDLDNPFIKPVDSSRTELLKGVQHFARKASPTRIEQLIEYMNFLIMQDKKEGDDQ